MGLLFFFSPLVASATAVPAQQLLPAIIIVYDDGHIQDLTKAFPVHHELDKPAVAAVNPDTLGNQGVLNKNDLQYLQTSGWEIASHGQNHAFLGPNQVQQQITKGARLIKIDNPHFVEKRYNYLLFNNDSEKVERIQIEEIFIFEDKSFIKTRKPVDNDYFSSETFIMPCMASMQTEIVNSKHELENLELNINSFVYPYNAYTSWAKDIAQKHYNFARAGITKHTIDPEDKINFPPLDCHSLKALCFETDFMTDHDLMKMIEVTKNSHGLLILYAHSGNKGFCTKRLELILQSAQKMEINVLTFQDLPDSFCEPKTGPEPGA